MEEEKVKGELTMTINSPSLLDDTLDRINEEMKGSCNDPYKDFDGFTYDGNCSSILNQSIETISEQKKW